MKMIQLVEEGYLIVICTIQSRFNSDIGTKIEAICKELGVYTMVLVSTGYTRYRKPMIWMWDYLINNAPCIIKGDCFYVGDAIDNKLEHSNCELIWTYNVGIQFYYSYAYFNSPEGGKSNRIYLKVSY